MSIESNPPGHRRWVFPDGEIPPHDPYHPEMKNDGTHGHESLVILNAGPEAVNPVLHIYFPDQDPWRVELQQLPGKRVACYRTDEPLGLQKVEIPVEKQYALVLECEHPVVAQLGRMDIRQPNLAYYTVIGFPGSTL